MVLILGIAAFMMKFFSFNISTTTFVSYWYPGAFLGSLPILWLERKNKIKLFQKGVWRVPLASFGILGSLVTLYWTFQLAPAGVVLPIKTLGFTLLPIIIGLLIFKEKKKLTKNQILGFILGIIGVVLVVISQIN